MQGQHERLSLVNSRSVAGEDVQVGGQIENRFVGYARCKTKKERIFSNLKIKNIECQPTERIFE